MGDRKPLTEQELADARALCEAATPGPWRTGTNGAAIRASREQDDQVIACAHRDAFWNSTDGALPKWLNDSEFIAAARTLVPRLLADLDAARADHARDVAEVEGEAREMATNADREKAGRIRAERYASQAESRLAEVERERDAALARVQELETARDTYKEMAEEDRDPTFAGYWRAAGEAWSKWAGGLVGLGPDPLTRYGYVELREEISKRLLEVFQAESDLAVLQADQDALAKRVQELEAGLRQYGPREHVYGNCPRWNMPGLCVCGTMQHNAAVDRLLGGGS